MGSKEAQLESFPFDKLFKLFVSKSRFKDQGNPPPFEVVEDFDWFLWVLVPRQNHR